MKGGRDEGREGGFSERIFITAKVVFITAKIAFMFIS